MAHYAYLDNDNIVVQVITGRNENEVVDGISDWEEYYSQLSGYNCKRTSYNTDQGVHLNGGTPFRKNYAGIGFKYDQTRDAFIPPKPFDSWVLNTTSFRWEAPIAYPTDGNHYVWNEQNETWDLVQ